MTAPRAYGLLGWPVGHSRSPALFRAAFAAAAVDAVYAPFPCPPEALADAVRGVRALGIAGLNVTIPHKTAVGAFLDAVDGDARALGAVNVVTAEQGRLVGTNTDAEGLARSLEEADVALAGAPAVVVGAGGAARAAVLALVRRGAGEVRVLARRPEAAEAVARALAASVEAPVTAGWLADRARFDGAAVLVQATDATLVAPGDDDGAVAAGAFAAALPLDRLAPGAVVVDLVYAPRETAVLRAAASLGLRTVEGAGMLVHQAALAFERWCGLPAPLGAMRDAFARG